MQIVARVTVDPRQLRMLLVLLCPPPARRLSGRRRLSLALFFHLLFLLINFNISKKKIKFVRRDD
jgi:hypothetical protein